MVKGLSAKTDLEMSSGTGRNMLSVKSAVRAWSATVVTGRAMRGSAPTTRSVA